MSESIEVDKKLVHRVLWSIVISIVSIGGYMIAWAVNFSGWQSKITEQVSYIVISVDKFNNHLQAPCHGVACEKLRTLERETIELEDAIKRKK